MAVVQKRRRLTNPSSRRRKLSPKQIKYFGTKRQKAALKSSRKRTTVSRTTARRKPRARKRVRRNIGEIITIGLNPSPIKRIKRSLKSMARKRRVVRKRRRVTNAPVRRRRRRSVAAAPRRRARRNPGYRVRRRISRRRRNPNFLTGTIRKAAGIIGGAAAVKLIVDRLPYGLSTGPISYLSTAGISVILGFGISKFGKNKSLGDDVMLGGFTYLTLRLLQDFVPSIASISPIGVRGMGIIGPSNFYVPQVPQGGSMRSFVPPPSVMAASAAGMQGMGGRRFARRA